MIYGKLMFNTQGVKSGNHQKNWSDVCDATVLCILGNFMCVAHITCNMIVDFARK